MDSGEKVHLMTQEANIGKEMREIWVKEIYKNRPTFSINHFEEGNEIDKSSVVFQVSSFINI